MTSPPSVTPPARRNRRSRPSMWPASPRMTRGPAWSSPPAASCIVRSARWSVRWLRWVSETHLSQRTDHRADLTMQEAAGGELQAGPLVMRGDAGHIEGLDRRFRLAGGVTEGGEVMQADQERGGLRHRLDRKRLFDMPDA